MGGSEGKWSGAFPVAIVTVLAFLVLAAPFGRAARQAIPAGRCSDGELPRISPFLALWAAFTARAEAAEAGGGRVHIVIDLNRLRLTLYSGDRPVKDFPVAIGKPSTPSPVGEWTVLNKGSLGGPFGSRWMGLDVPWGVYGVHGTNAPGSIGWQASAGCIRMFNEHVEEVFEYVTIGTPVTIVGPVPYFYPSARYQEGDLGEPLVVLQKKLREAGFPPGRADGRYGRYTVRAVRSLEGFYGLEADGVAGRDVQLLTRFRE